MATDELLTRNFFSHVAQTSDDPMGISIDHAEGMYVFGTDGKKYIDLVAGISVCNMGHSHPAIVKAVQKQVAKYMHVMVYGEVIQRPQVELATLLCNQLPENLSTVFFVNSGSEAVEGGLKLAKRATGRQEMIHCEHAYHGCTHGAMSVMGCNDFRKAFEPLLPQTRAIRFGCEEDLQLITEKTACFIIEPVQGEGGIQTADKHYWQAVRNRCTETGTMLIFDEIQTGLGRTGKLFAFEHYDIKPDILLLAKALGGGLPLGAFIASSQIMELLTHNPALGHISTFGGHPVSCAAALAHLKLILDHKMWQHVEEKGQILEAIFKQLPNLKEIRRKGLMMALDFKDTNYCLKMDKKFLEVGLLTDWFLFCDTALRIAPPLIISDHELQEIEQIIKQIR